ncbi:MAG: hypothetical protein QNJ35_10730 [Paracoccaceae bacterium]|nr:hypothetical protein [Paracoccaceae bacterium]
MTIHVTKPEARDDVDVIIDTLLAEPERAEDLKTMLRHKMAAPEVVAVAHAKPVSKPDIDAQDDVEDLWDNVPV